MKINEGTLDRVLRTIVGAALLAWVLVFAGPVWAWIGVVPLVTGLVGICPLYSILGLSTCPVKQGAGPAK
ncbi:MAG: DUF2892 domain-containing protein [Pseudomonadales bacterium]|nr:DUF2892 domain-containing protein [Pseudomonadales bacterium]